MFSEALSQKKETERKKKKYTTQNQLLTYPKFVPWTWPLSQRKHSLCHAAPSSTFLEQKGPPHVIISIVINPNLQRGWQEEKIQYKCQQGVS